ncbi:hypothetical protein CFP65_1997 [Kitasatospora sp. MMS16-BH015]|uniref:hypothetical protein n=1 Tax=Kitasatospora sp. MMS16-BH015 TaxID=2018025 RepID=UPI000CA1DFEE|nr:hypothetical protein [Kitasatospora sp. MMS16-BH015]AUG76862.1 hypothetical protein CFP65_1997 [Kitasatospora sp. MMS16-BH015]
MHRPPSPFAGTTSSNWRDAALLTRPELEAATGEVQEDLLAVWVRRAGTWHPAVFPVKSAC